MKIKEEIIEKYTANCEYPSYYHESDIEKMMDDYAREHSLAFTKWCIKEGWTDFDGVDCWINIGKGRKVITTDQLYEKFCKAITPSHKTAQ